MMDSTRNQVLLLAVLLIGLFAWHQFFSGLPMRPGFSSIKANVQENFQKPLAVPPGDIKAIYYTMASGGSDEKIDYLIKLAERSEINAVVIDIKDFSGYIAYDTDMPEAELYKAERTSIKNIDGLIERLHREGIYVIARMAVFQDPVLARARPDLAVKNGSQLWYDRNGLAWIDPASRDAWDYYVALAQDAASRGFDEINFDYIRFPSDGNLQAMRFPFWDRTVSRREVLKSFFQKLREELPHQKLSADLFGFVTTIEGDFGIGQVIEDAFPYFDYISPMVYPSHYPKAFLGFTNSAEHPYQVISHVLKSGLKRLEAFKQSYPETNAQIRPWLQDFDMGADYDAAKVRAQIRATMDVFGDHFNGYMLWNAKNVYTEGAIVE